jgi:hypothetical protein
LVTNELITKGFHKDSSRSFDLLYELSKSLSKAHGYQKVNSVPYWEAYLKDRNVKNHIQNFRGERLNIAFLAGGAAYFHQDDILAFIDQAV